ncbi:MAG: Agmatine deiminase [Ignavibacteriaceae bacterium]|nr:Agmatine deiminase [Ignavibacteriaceae bacterium]
MENFPHRDAVKYVHLTTTKENNNLKYLLFGVTNLKKLILFLLVLLVFRPLAQDLPKGLTPAEEQAMKGYIFPSSTEGVPTPPDFPVRTMAEWEPLGALIITWTSYTAILRDIVRYAQDEVPVYIICSDSNTVKNYLTQGGVPLNNLNFLITSFNSVWVRDYGPWTVYGGGVDSLLLIDWVYNRPRPNDDVTPQFFANRYGAVLHEMTSEPNRFVATGGNFMNDGMGTGFSSKLILTENPGKTEAQINAMVDAYMGINRYIKMDVLPYDGIHHIDMHMKLLDEETILVGEYPLGVADGPQIELNLQYIQNNFLNAFGRPYKFVRILMPPDASNRYPNQGGDYRTYTNSVFVNKTVIVPTYELRYDTTALRIYREALPGYRIVGINSNVAIPAGGAIHCITKEVGVKDQIHIVHNRLPFRAPVPGQGYPLKAFVNSKLPVSSASLYYTTDTTAGWSSVPLQFVAADTALGFIPEIAPGVKIYYYFSVSTANRTLTRPITAPANCFNFTTDEPVPVELLSFDGYSQNGDVFLRWSTATELNNKGFEIQKKMSGTQAWGSVAFVPGGGTSVKPLNYSFVDKSPGAGNFLYRLKQIDYNGESRTYNEVEVSVEEFSYLLYQNYPNPVNAGESATAVFFTLGEDSYTDLTLYNALGEKISVPVEGNLSKGIHKLELSTANLPAGVYFYRLNSKSNESGKNYSMIKKMIITK